MRLPSLNRPFHISEKEPRSISNKNGDAFLNSFGKAAATTVAGAIIGAIIRGSYSMNLAAEKYHKFLESNWEGFVKLASYGHRLHGRGFLAIPPLDGVEPENNIEIVYISLATLRSLPAKGMEILQTYNPTEEIVVWFKGSGIFAKIRAKISQT